MASLSFSIEALPAGDIFPRCNCGGPETAICSFVPFRSAFLRSQSPEASKTALSIPERLRLKFPDLGNVPKSDPGI